VALELIVLLLSGPAPPTDADLYDLATAAFVEARGQTDPRKGRSLYRQSAERFAQLGSRGYHSPALYRAQGNAWLLAGDLPRAILAYQRGRALDPSDLALRQCLAHARDKVRYPAESAFGRPPVDNRPPWLPYIGPTPLVLGVLTVGYTLACALLARWWLRSDPRALFFATVGFSLIVVAVAGLWLVVVHDRADADRPLVVVASNDVYLLRGNGPAYPRAHSTPMGAGVEARLLVRRGDWLQIELSGGELGWVPASAVLVDE
jgi:hypothetical protein